MMNAGKRSRDWPKLMAACLLIAAAGCATWSARPEEVARLPGGRLAADCVALEVALAQVPENWDNDGQLWQEVDERRLTTDVRRRLQDNGLRTGILGAQIPEVLRTSLEQSAEPLESLMNEGSPKEGDLFSKNDGFTSGRAARTASR